MEGKTIQWADLTPAQQQRLVAVSRGEEAPLEDDTYWYLRNSNLITFIENDWGDVVYYPTPTGGALLAERDTVMIDALKPFAKVADQKDNWEEDQQGDFWLQTLEDVFSDHAFEAARDAIEMVKGRK